MRHIIGSLLIALTLMVIGGEFHITISKVVSVAKAVKEKVAPEVHYLAQEIAESTK
jgi:hypothetical protein